MSVGTADLREIFSPGSALSSLGSLAVRPGAGRNAASPAGRSLTPGIARFTGAKAGVGTAIAR